MIISQMAECALQRVQPERHNLRLKLKNNKKKAASLKLQALKRTQFRNRIKIESEENMEVKQLKRIADAIEEILRLVKKDMEPKKK